MRTYYIHMDIALLMLGSMPPFRKDESRKSIANRKSQAATQMEKDFGLRAYQVPGKKARRYILSEVEAAQKLIKRIAA